MDNEQRDWYYAILSHLKGIFGILFFILVVLIIIGLQIDKIVDKL